jgi:hypothetical protein
MTTVDRPLLGPAAGDKPVTSGLWPKEAPPAPPARDVEPPRELGAAPDKGGLSGFDAGLVEVVVCDEVGVVGPIAVGAAVPGVGTPLVRGTGTLLAPGGDEVAGPVAIVVVVATVGVVVAVAVVVVVVAVVGSPVTGGVGTVLVVTVVAVPVSEVVVG